MASKMSVDNEVWLSIPILGFLLVVVAAVRSRRKEPDYRTFFTMGLIWVIVGLLFQDLSGLFTLGLIFLLIGLVNYEKWGKPSQDAL
ncbi:MAG: hypothetical protein ACE5I5_12300 [Candidatus Heimdallarchaeota archaeon]